MVTQRSPSAASLTGVAGTGAVPAAPGVFQRFERLQRLGTLGFMVLILALALAGAVQMGRSMQSVQAHEDTQVMLGQINQLRGRLLDVEGALLVRQTVGDAVPLRSQLRCASPCPSAAALQVLADGPGQRELFAQLAVLEGHLGPLLRQALEGEPAVAAQPQPVIGQMRRLLLLAEEGELAALRRQDEVRRQQMRHLQLVMAATLVAAFGGALALQQRTRTLVDAGLAAERALQEASLRDPLTGCHNRRALDLHLDRMLRLAQRAQSPLALMAIDLDGFKAVNDAHGHAAGDAVLREVAARLHAVLRDTDLIARIGGDEFVAVLAGADGEAGALAAARRLLQALQQPVVLGSGASARVGASVGLALYPRDAQGGSALLHAADGACYAAKRAGKNQVRVAAPAEPPA